MGVLPRNRFTAAWQYNREATVPREGELVPGATSSETLGQIITADRWIHCHSIGRMKSSHSFAMMEQFGVRVGTLQHVLEGYKVADETAHGAGGSCRRLVGLQVRGYRRHPLRRQPHARARRGGFVQLRPSDLARRMNLESAKAVKYGNTKPAMQNFVTLNPARQLRVDQ